METHGEETKRTSKEAMDRWYKAGFREIRDIKLERKGTQSGRVEGVVGGVKNSSRVVMPMRERKLFCYNF